MPGKNKQQENNGQLKENSKKRTVQTDADTAPDTSSPTPGSMSEGNLSNNPHGREKRGNPHSKTFITGSDDDGQAV